MSEPYITFFILLIGLVAVVGFICGYIKGYNAAPQDKPVHKSYRRFL